MEDIPAINSSSSLTGPITYCTLSIPSPPSSRLKLLGLVLSRKTVWFASNASLNNESMLALARSLGSVPCMEPPVKEIYRCRPGTALNDRR